MAKTAKERLSDTMAYVADHVESGRAMEVVSLMSRLTAVQKDQLGTTIQFDHTGAGGAGQRRAVRANMLLSQLMIEDPMWRTVSVSPFAMPYLKSATEVQLRSRLKSWWADPAVKEADVCNAGLEAFGSMPDWGNNPCDPSRIQGRVGPYTAPLNCFSGVMYWAYRAGAVSLRWLWNDWTGLESDDANGVKRNYVMGFNSAQVWKPSDMSDGKYLVPAGHTVQFVNKDAKGRGTAFGHVVLSIGGGRCLSQNRCDGFRAEDVEGGVPPEDQQAVARMRAGRVQNVALRTLRQGFYAEKEGYHTMHSAAPFWLYGLH